MNATGADVVLSEAEIKRLRWRSRRGMLELDLLLLPFFDEVFPELTEAQQNTFVNLLDQEDPDLWSWFSRQRKPEDADLADMVEMILGRMQPG